MSDKPLNSSDSTSKMLGVIGGGQLAQMLAEAGKKRNIEFAIQTSSQKDPAACLAQKIILSDQDNYEKTNVCRTQKASKLLGNSVTLLL